MYYVLDGGISLTVIFMKSVLSSGFPGLFLGELLLIAEVVYDLTEKQIFSNKEVFSCPAMLSTTTVFSSSSLCFLSKKNYWVWGNRSTTSNSDVPEAVLNYELNYNTCKS